jgi:hypothetical protein
MSFIPAAAAPLKIWVLVVTLKTRVASLPEIVKVLFFWSMAETIPWKGSGRGFCLIGGEFVAEEEEEIGEADADRPALLGMVWASVEKQKASGAMPTAATRHVFEFIFSTD